uniref:G-protein coupled receptors family 1 profile domain-containing protein n=1 Tax=Parascaris univalens TaxID=6257 RepID=A0A915AH35_PARUN
MKATPISSSADDSSAVLKLDKNNVLSTADLFVFTGLESLGCLAVLGNLCLIVVLIRVKYVSRASFILILSLAIADVLHGLVTTFYFYPPIALKRHHLSIFVMRIFNIIDWTAWAITLTHMSAICLDRLTAIMLYGRYSMTVTVKRIRTFSVSCWVVFTTANTVFFFFDACCMILPLKDHEYYSFGYHPNDTKFRGSGILNYTNVYVYAYTPVEIITIVVLLISNPITLIQLYRRRKRKQALRQASAMLIAMSMKMGQRTLSGEARETAIRKANRQQQRIMVQISIITVIFFSYMSSYYLSYYVFSISNKWSIVFHSFFYSTTHMINPVIYFICNGEMRNQLKEAIRVFWLYATCRGKSSIDEFAYSCSKSTHGDKPANKINSTLPTETSPLFSSNSQYKSMAIRRLSIRMDKTSSSLTHLICTMTPTQSDSLLTRTKASSIRFDEKSNKIVVDIINDSGNHIQGADSGISQKQSSFKKGNDYETNTTLNTDNLTPEATRRSSQELIRQRTSLLHRLIASLSADEHQDGSEYSSSDDDVFLSSSSSNSLIQTKLPTQSYSEEFTSFCAPLDHSVMRLSSTMDALPAALTSVSQNPFHTSDLASQHISEEDSRPLLQSCPTDDDNNTSLFELNRSAPALGCSSLKGEMMQNPPTAAVKNVQRSENNAEQDAFNGKCDETNPSMQVEHLVHSITEG